MLTDGNLTLRPPEDDDAQAICDAVQDPEIPKWTNIPSPYVLENATQWIERTRVEQKAGRTRAFLAFLDGELAASISFMELDKGPRYGEIGYWVAANARRKGVASRSVELLKAYGRDELGLTLMELLVNEANVASRRTAERAGFRSTGERRPAPRTETPDPPMCIVYAWSAE